MLPFSLTSFLKYLIGVVFVQGVTVLLVFTAFKTDLEKTGLLFAALNLAIGALTAFWFTSMAEGARKQTLSKAKESFAREREKIRVRAEQEKTKQVLNSERELHRQKSRAKTSGNLKTGLMLGGAAGVGVVMVLAQFVTLGLLTLTTAGGAALGYGFRARQDRLSLGGKGLLRSEKAINVIAAQPSAPAIEGKGKRPKAVGKG
jgi:microsomal dipeptidase-like Zn-dependent dipeptidase